MSIEPLQAGGSAIIASSSTATLPAPDGNSRLARLTDGSKSLVQSNGTVWTPVSNAWPVYRLENFGGIANDSSSGARVANNAAWETMLLAMAPLTDFSSAYKVQFGSGNYYFSDEIHCKHVLIIEGTYAGLQKALGTVLWFPPKSKGLWVDAVYPFFSGYTGAGTHLANFTIKHDQNLANWVTATSYPSGSAIMPTSLRGWGGYVFVNLGASGTSGSTEPVWPEDISALTFTDGMTVSDGTVTWTAQRNALLNIRAMMTAEKVFADSGYGDGWWIYSDSFDHILTDLVTLYHCGATNNRSTGLMNSGGDNTSAGALYQFEATNNGCWGVRDQSFLGNTYHGLDVSYNGPNRGVSPDMWTSLATWAANYELSPTSPNGYTYRSSAGTAGSVEPTWPTTLGSTVVDGTITWTCYRKYRGGAAYFGSFCTIFGMYSEGGQLPIHNDGTLIGEAFGTTIDATSAGLTISNTKVLTTLSFTNTQWGGSAKLGQGSSGVLELAPPISVSALSYAVKYNHGRTGWWSWNYGNGGSPNSDAFAFSDITASEGASKFWLPNGTYLGQQGSAVLGTNLSSASLALTAGTYAQGDIKLNNAAKTLGSPLGWRCITAGTPGAWEPLFTARTSGPALLSETSVDQHWVGDDIDNGFSTWTSRVGAATLTATGEAHIATQAPLYHRASSYSPGGYLLSSDTVGITPGGGLSAELLLYVNVFGSQTDLVKIISSTGSGTAFIVNLTSAGALNLIILNTDTTTHLQATTGNIIQTGKYYLVTGVFNDATGTVTLYVNGVPVASANTPSGTISNQVSRQLFNLGGSDVNLFEMTRVQSALSYAQVLARSQAFLNAYYPMSQFSQPTAKTANYTLIVSDQNSTLTNDGAAGTVIFTLPPAAVGLSYSFSVETAQIFRAVAVGSDVIRIGASQSAAAGNVQSSVVGSALLLRCTKTGIWTTVGGAAGTWTVT